MLVSQHKDESNDKKTFQIFKVLLKLFVLLWEVSSLHLVILIILKVLQIFIPILQMFLVTRLIDRITSFLIPGASSELFDTIIHIVLLQIGLLILNSILKSIERIVMFQLKAKTKFYIQNEVGKKTTQISYENFENPQLYDEIYKASTGDRSLDLVDASVQIVQDIFTLISYLIVIGTLLDWRLAGIICVLFVISLIANMKLGHLKFTQIMNQTPLNRKMNYFFSLLTGKDAAKEIRTFDLSNYLMNKWKKVYWSSYSDQQKLEIKATLILSILDVFIIVTVNLIILYLAQISYIKQYSIGLFVAVNQAITTSQSSISILSMQISRIYNNALYAKELFSFLEKKNEITGNHTEKIFPERIEKGIYVKNLYFSYSTGKYSLENVSFEIKKGQKIAIVGHNGAGKSTLAKCLLGLYNPSQGEIYYDDLEIRDIERQSFTKRVTSVFQDFVRYQLTLRENIGFGNVEKMDDEALLNNSINKAGLEKKIFKKGFDTQLGTIFNGGVDLSIGQWQKISLSRAFISEAEIIILDEPTAALDPITEVEVFDKFLELSGDKTAIFITHRLGSCKSADNILVLDNGKLIEQGTHEELVKMNGEYAEMFKMQSEWYL
ncbi:ABC transporter ATP-binding protein [Paenibacillus sp. Leaf72]|uniref:ABC transporter ATP-binding protein n=1 Tax=Paenibacillus sp. Leaf72 TaxID=1736234 RepID=UPI0006F9834E|nr:ABC transporter ATP-binding protein [Paenibacillus sp. Leaf72]KQO17408.1 hypothetical protein ASF12_01585 [Paenibacillus sp. Leaf72]